jgi:hypothetical protein
MLAVSSKQENAFALKLNSKNYIFWRYCAESSLVARKLWYVVHEEPNQTPPAQNAPAEVKEAEMKKLETTQDEINTALTSSLDQSMKTC